LLSGSLLSHYRVLSLLDPVAWEVYLATTNAGRNVALKLLLRA